MTESPRMGVLKITGEGRTVTINLGQRPYIDNASLTVIRLTPATVGWRSSTARFKVTWEGLVGDPVITVTDSSGGTIPTSGTVSLPTFVIPDNLTQERPK